MLSPGAGNRQTRRAECGDTMSLPPLSHHEIIGLVAPFARQGRQVDLAASDRLARRLVFRPRPSDGGVPGHAEHHELLQLEQPEAGPWLLTRTLTLAKNLAPAPRATAQARGDDPAELLTRLDAVDPQRQFAAGPGWVLAYSHRVDAGPRVRLTQAAARLDGLTLNLSVPAVRGYPADLWVVPDAEQRIELPDDLLAVLGGDWSQLQRIGGRWSGTLRLRGQGAERSHRLQAAWQAAVMHVARTLAETPAAYHQRLAGARWRVALRRSLPMGVALGGIGAALAVPALGLGQDSPLRMLVFNAPPLLMALGVSLKELPRFELPRIPRPPTLASWRQGR
jgi:hypothetical protein